MDDKSLASKAVGIKGKQYVLVSDRVLYFNEKYENGEIATEIVSAPDAQRVIVKAIVRPDTKSTRVFIAHSQAVIGEGMVNKTAALENAETSAVGRALAFMGIGVIESVASADEIHKATAPQSPVNAPQRRANPPAYKSPGAKEHEAALRTEAAKERIVFLLTKLDRPTKTKKQCEDAIFDLTDMALTEENYDAIGDALAKALAAQE